MFKTSLPSRVNLDNTIQRTVIINHCAIGWGQPTPETSTSSFLHCVSSDSDKLAIPTVPAREKLLLPTQVPGLPGFPTETPSKTRFFLSRCIAQRVSDGSLAPDRYGIAAYIGIDFGGTVFFLFHASTLAKSAREGIIISREMRLRPASITRKRGKCRFQR